MPLENSIVPAHSAVQTLGTPQARERVWLQAAETDRLPTFTMAGGVRWPGIRLLVYATLVTAHSEKEAAAPTFTGCQHQQVVPRLPRKTARIFGTTGHP